MTSASNTSNDPIATLAGLRKLNDERTTLVRLLRGEEYTNFLRDNSKLHAKLNTADLRKAFKKDVSDGKQDPFMADAVEIENPAGTKYETDKWMIQRLTIQGQYHKLTTTIGLEREKHAQQSRTPEKTEKKRKRIVKSSEFTPQLPGYWKGGDDERAPEEMIRVAKKHLMFTMGLDDEDLEENLHRCMILLMPKSKKEGFTNKIEEYFIKNGNYPDGETLASYMTEAVGNPKSIADTRTALDTATQRSSGLSSLDAYTSSFLQTLKRLEEKGVAPDGYSAKHAYAKGLHNDTIDAVSELLIDSEIENAGEPARDWIKKVTKVALQKLQKKSTAKKTDRGKEITIAQIQKIVKESQEKGGGKKAKKKLRSTLFSPMVAKGRARARVRAAPKEKAAKAEARARVACSANTVLATMLTLGTISVGITRRRKTSRNFSRRCRRKTSTR